MERKQSSGFHRILVFAFYRFRYSIYEFYTLENTEYRAALQKIRRKERMTDTNS